MRYQGRFVVSHQPAAVFGFVADVRNEEKWNPRIRSIQKVTEGPVTTGTLFDGDYAPPMGRLRITVTQHAAPRRVCFSCQGRNMDFDVQIEIGPEGPRSAVALDMQVRPRGVFRLLLPILARSFQRQNDAALARMCEGIERGLQRPPSMP